MGRPRDEDQLDIFISTLAELGGSAGNVSLQRELGWSEDEYWRLRKKLIERGDIVKGRGRGGSVVIAEHETSDDDTTEKAPNEAEDSKADGRPREQDLYAPCLQVLRTKWANLQNLERLELESRPNQGSRPTGGTWTRPDIAGVSLRVFKFWPGRAYDLWTFEVKPRWSFNVVGIFEAAAHSRYVNHSWALFHVSEERLDGREEKDRTTRMIEESRRLGVGLILFTQPDDFATWDIRVESQRQARDPYLHEEFVVHQLGDACKEELLKWSKS